MSWVIGMAPTIKIFFFFEIFFGIFLGIFFFKSVSYQKKDGRVTRGSFFWYDNDSGH